MEVEWKYLGDGVYALYDGYHVVLRTDNSGRIYLDPYVMSALVAFHAHATAQGKEGQDA